MVRTERQSMIMIMMITDTQKNIHTMLMVAITTIGKMVLEGLHIVLLGRLWQEL